MEQKTKWEPKYGDVVYAYEEPKEEPHLDEYDEDVFITKTPRGYLCASKESFTKLKSGQDVDLEVYEYPLIKKVEPKFKKESEQLKVAKLTIEEIRKEFGIREDMQIEIEGFISEAQAINDVAEAFKQFDEEEEPKWSAKTSKIKFEDVFDKDLMSQMKEIRSIIQKHVESEYLKERIAARMDSLGLDKHFTRPGSKPFCLGKIILERKA